MDNPTDAGYRTRVGVPSDMSTTPPARLNIGIGLLAGSLMLFQISLTRIFSFSIWHHFAFMIISVALLGFAVSGIALRLWPVLGIPPTPRAALYALSFAITSALAVRLVTRVPFDPTRLADQPRQLTFLVLHYGALLVPFAFAGLALVTLLQANVACAGRLYGSDLVGAGLGCVAAVWVIQQLGADGAIFVTAAMAAIAAGLFGLGTRNRDAVSWVLVVVFGAVAVTAPGLLSVPAGPGKGLHTVLDTSRFPQARLALTRWNAISRVDVVEGSAGVTWTANPAQGITAPRQTLFVIDGDAATPVIHLDPRSVGGPFLESMLSSAVIEAFRPERVLVLGAGGGVDVLAALHFGVRRVDAVEVNPAIVELMTKGRYFALSGGLFSRPGVRLLFGEGRSFVRHSDQHYDAIQLALVDTWAASVSGAYSLAEGYLYTVEAFRDYLDRLEPHGVLGVTRWLVWPPRETLKLCAVADAALRAEGVAQPGAHIAVFGRANLSTVLVKRAAFTLDERARMQSLARQRGFVVLYPDGLGTSSNPFGAFLEGVDREQFYRTYPYDVRPATDDSPFFFNFGRWRDLDVFGAGWKEGPIALSGRLLLVSVLAQAVLLSMTLLLLPSMRSRKSRDVNGRRTVRVLIFFFLIGLSFMFIEIALMQRLTLFLGHPVYAIALVLAVLLFSAGLGSLSAHAVAGREPWLVFLVIAGLSLTYAFAMPVLFDFGLGFGLPTRLALSAALVFPLGFALGVPFPTALTRLARRQASENIVSWAWAANGSASVLGPIVAVMIALDVGFSAVFAMAAIGYAAAYRAFPWTDA